MNPQDESPNPSQDPSPESQPESTPSEASPESPQDSPLYDAPFPPPAAVTPPNPDPSSSHDQAAAHEHPAYDQSSAYPPHTQPPQQQAAYGSPPQASPYSSQQQPMQGPIYQQPQDPTYGQAYGQSPAPGPNYQYAPPLPSSQMLDPYYYSPMSLDKAQRKVRFLSYVMMGSGFLTIFFMVLINPFFMYMQWKAGQLPKEFSAELIFIAFAMYTLVAILPAGIMIFGAYKMQEGKSRGTALLAATAACIPCNLICLLTFPLIGIIAWIILMQHDVKAWFQVKENQRYDMASGPGQSTQQPYQHPQDQYPPDRQ